MKKTLNAVICVLNSKYIHSSLSPWCLLAGINSYCEKDISATIVEGTINENIENIAQRIVSEKPDIIGFSCYIWNISATTKLYKLVKSLLPNVKIILGGPEVSYRADEILSNDTTVDYIISGEGEKPFALLLNSVLHCLDVKNIEGICLRQNGKAIISEPYTPSEEPPSPYSNEYFKALNGRIAYLETSRGCPFSCAFCLSGRCGNVRYYDMERAKKEIILLSNSGTQTVKLIDRTFNANRARALEIFRFIIDNYGIAIPKGVCFHFEIAGDLLDDETLYVLSQAPIGAMQFEIGLQSFNEKTLEAINRKTNVNKLISNIKTLISNKNMHIHIDLIAGLPFEDLESFKHSFEIAFELKPNMLQLGFLKLLYGAPMRENRTNFPCNYSNNPPYEVTDTPWISHEELESLHNLEDALEHLSNSGRFSRTMDYVLNQTKCSPFDLLMEFGQYASKIGVKRISLDDYTALFYNFFIKLNGIDKTILRDKMVCDRLSTNSSGKLPSILRIEDKNLKTAIKKLSLEQKPKKGIKRGYALLYSNPSLVYCDYENKNPITGEYELNYYKISN